MMLHECRILLVDDEDALLYMVGDLLKKEGYQYIDMAADCRSAMRLTRGKEYELVLLDVMLPDGDGFTLFEQIRRLRGGGMPVIFLSARDEDQARLRGLGLGADDYITKPFLPEELLLRIRAVLKRTYHIDDVTGTDRVGKSTDRLGCRDGQRGRGGLHTHCKGVCTAKETVRKQGQDSLHQCSVRYTVA